MRSLLGRMMRVIAALLLVVLSLFTLRSRLSAGAASVLVARPERWEAWLEHVRRLRSSSLFRRADPGHRRHTVGAADAHPAPVAARARRARVLDARRRDGVVGFVLGLTLVTVALAAAVAFAAHPVR